MSDLKAHPRQGIFNIYINLNVSYQSVLTGIRGEMAQLAVTDLFCFGAKSTGVVVFSKDILAN